MNGMFVLQNRFDDTDVLRKTDCSVIWEFEEAGSTADVWKQIIM